MSALLQRVGAFCARHHRLVIVAWLVIAVGLGVTAGKLGTETNDNVSLPGTDSQRAADVLERDFPSAENGANPIVLRAPAGTRLTDPAQAATIARLERAFASDAAVRTVVSPLSRAGIAQLSPDGRIGYLNVTLRAGPTELTLDTADRLLAQAQRIAAEGRLDVAAGGYLGADLSQPGSADSDAIGLAAAVIVLLFTFGTFVAMGLPILTAILGLGTGLSLITILTHVVQIPSTASALATMIGLGVGIDYALFVVTRHRELMAEGKSVPEAIEGAIATAGHAVVFAGGTVIIALCSLLLTGIPIVAQLGCVAAIAVLVAVAAALTLLPAALAAVGTKIDRLALPGRRRGSEALDSRPRLGEPRDDEQTGVWWRWARFVARRPWPALAVALVLIGALAWPLFTLQLGQSDTGQLPRTTTARQAYDLLADGFGAGSNGPLLVAVRLAGADRAADAAALEKLRAAIARTDGVAAAGPAVPAPNGQAALLTVIPRSAPSADATERLVRELRRDAIPAALGDGAGAPRAYVGGQTAGFIDLSDEISDRLPVVIAIVLALSFLLLTAAFRSLVVPLKAVVMNLLSIGAAFGIVSYVFSHDWSAQLIGVDGVSPIVSFVPLMMFAILFGLSMDYEVFLMTRMRERWLATGDAHRAAIEGLAGTARTITSAALIMVSVFCAFLLNGNPTIKQFGLGMAAAVAVDATVIRCLLVPAVMTLLGERAWWFPGRRAAAAQPAAPAPDAAPVQGAERPPVRVSG